MHTIPVIFFAGDFHRGVFHVAKMFSLPGGQCNLTGDLNDDTLVATLGGIWNLS